ncbi:SUKH-4 family immunity protein [Streptomyces novaecaesareae]|uniref:SUKH-4 family immunity protein n=1 Tax=Streptomyces novaecaesareae TaxID=68244 RepID=UPI000525B22D|nr:SUKH-4 family immunity protein [Streptomyces novaecaesareae]
MVTYAQAQELAEEWINGGVPRAQQREVRVREFDLGFVCWAVAPGDGAAGPGGVPGGGPGGGAEGSSGSGEARLVIARDSGASTLWPALPVNEVVRQYEEVYGRPVAANPAGAAKPAPGPVEATSFLLSPPQWLQEAGAAAIAAEAERLGGGSAGPQAAAPDSALAPTEELPGPAALAPTEELPGPAALAATEELPGPAALAATEELPGRAAPAAAVLTEPPVSDRPAGDAPTMLAPPPSQDGPFVVPPQPQPQPQPQAAVPLPPPAAPVAPAVPPVGAEAATVLMPEGLRTSGADLPDAPAPVGAEAATMLMPPGSGGYGMPPVPPSAVPPVAAQPPFAPPAAPPAQAPVPGPAVEPAPTLLAPPDAMPGLMGLPGAPATPPGAPVEHAPTMLAPPGGVPGLGGLPGAPATPPGAPVEHAPTMLAPPGGVPGLGGLPGAPATPAAEPPAAGAPQGGLGRAPASAPPPPPPAALRGGPAGSPGAGAAPAGLGRNAGSAPPPPPPAGLKHTAGTGTPSGAPGGRGAGSAPPPPPPAGLRGAEAPAPQGTPSGGTPAAGSAYEATQLASAIDPALLGGPADPGTPPSGGPAVPPPPGGPAAPAAPAAGYGYPNAGGAAGVVPPAAVTGSPQPAPVPPGVPAVGPGYFAALSYRGPDGSEQKLLHRSEPGTPHPEWKILQDLRRLNVPPEQVLELYTELESCDLPGGYCNRMIAASWPNVRLTHTAPYGRDHASRQAGMAELLDHLDELHQLASGAQRVRPFRVPPPAPGTVQALPPLPPQQLAQEVGAAFGQNLFRYEQRAVSRQGVPEPVSQTLMWAGLPRDFGPFFWAQAQEGRPIPTLAELAAERGLAGGPDFGGYLVLGNDYGRQLCVQYGTANVVAVDIDGTAQPPRFVNSGVPEFVRALALLGRMWRLRYGLTPDQAGRWTTDFQAQLAAIDPAALQNADTWWAVLLEQFWDGLL